MFIRATKRKNKDGTSVRYLQLAHNVRDPETGIPQARIIHNFGREDQLDREGLARLVSSISRFLDPEVALASQAPRDMRLMSSRAMGGTFLLDSLWKNLGIEKMLLELLLRRRYSMECERVIFALVANRVLGPCSKLSACDWAALPRAGTLRLFETLDLRLLRFGGCV